MLWKDMTYSGWGRVHEATGRVARPERLSHIPADAPAIGNCRSYGDVCLNDAGDAVQMSRLDRVLSFDKENGIIEVEAGLTISELARLCIPNGWLPAVMPGTGFATVGGAIANDVHGKNHHVLGSFSQHLTELQLLQNGKSKTVKPGSKLFKATAGGIGQTGIICKAKLQLIPCSGSGLNVREQRIDGIDQFIDALSGSLSPYSVGWIDATATGEHLGRGILEEAELSESDKSASSHSRKVPFDLPGWALSKPVVKAFNGHYFRRVPESGRSRTVAYDEFFFPLDKIHDWNRLYGKSGFHQFQCVVPMAKVDALRNMLEAISEAGCASPLAVLKRLGSGRGGYLSFPMEGFTLAVDFKNRPASMDLISTLEDMTAKADGRVYFAKDATLRPDLVSAMYPEFPEWQAEVSKADPTGAMATDLVRRLQLRGNS